MPGHELGAVTDAEHRQTFADLRQIGFEGLLVIDREGRAGKDDADHRLVVMRELVVGNNLAISVEFAHAAPDKLGGLRAEIKDNYFFLHSENGD